MVSSLRMLFHNVHMLRLRAQVHCHGERATEVMKPGPEAHQPSRIPRCCPCEMFRNSLTFNFEAEAKTLRSRPKHPEAEAGYEAEADAEAKNSGLEEALISLINLPLKV